MDDAGKHTIRPFEPTHDDRNHAMPDEHHPSRREARPELHARPLAAEAWRA